MEKVQEELTSSSPWAQIKAGSAMALPVFVTEIAAHLPTPSLIGEAGKL